LTDKYFTPGFPRVKAGRVSCRRTDFTTPRQYSTLALLFIKVLVYEHEERTLSNLR
jgi:hypothetical protein